LSPKSLLITQRRSFPQEQEATCSSFLSLQSDFNKAKNGINGQFGHIATGPLIE
jgi:hypothetical protein